MSNKHNANRKDFPDSKIMTALDVSDYNITATARYLGLNVPTLRNWIIKSANLSKYIMFKQAEGAVKAREVLESMLETEEGSVLLGVCKVLLDKFEPDLLKSDIEHTIEVDYTDNLKNLLGD